MTIEEHKARHVKLHQSLDELVADWITNSGVDMPLPSEHTIYELIEWSHSQTLNPTENKYAPCTPKQ